MITGKEKEKGVVGGNGEKNERKIMAKKEIITIQEGIQQNKIKTL